MACTAIYRFSELSILRFRMAGKGHNETMEIQRQGVIYTPFVNLNPDNTTQKAVKVLVLKMWKIESKKRDQVWSLEFHLIDHNGNQIHDRVGRDHVQLIQVKLEEGCVYFIQRFSLAKPTTGIVTSEYVMKLNMFSRIDKLNVDPAMFPREVFEFLAFENVAGRKNDATYYTNVIGKLASVSNIVKKSVGDGDVLMRENFVDNERGFTMNVTLWDEYVHVISDAIENDSMNVPAVLVVTDTNVKDHLGLSTTAASPVFINLNVQQLNEIKALIDLEAIGVGKVDFEEEKNLYGNIETFFAVTEKLQYNKNKNTVCYCEARIVEVLKSEDWYYMACRTCNKKVVYVGSRGSCSKCLGEYVGDVP